MMSNAKITAALITMVGLTVLPSGCTTLGPIAGMTGANMVPESRAGGELQVGIMPGYFLSHSVQDPAEAPSPSLDVFSNAVSQGAGWVGLGKYIKPVDGLDVGARWVFGSGDGYFEPMIRYRSWLDDDQRLSAGFTVFGTAATASERGASYKLAKGGLETALNIRITPKNRWAQLHATGGAGLTVLSASGTFCAKADTGYGRDCNEADQTTPAEVGRSKVDVLGVYPSAFVGTGVDLFTDVPYFSGLRVMLYAAGGTRPLFVSGVEQTATSWFGAGFTVTVGLGER
jgi:hypothetical protein